MFLFSGDLTYKFKFWLEMTRRATQEIKSSSTQLSQTQRQKLNDSFSSQSPATAPTTAPVTVDTTADATVDVTAKSARSSGLAEYRTRQTTIKAARVENGRRLSERIRRGEFKAAASCRKLSKSQKAGLILPVQHILKELKTANPNRMVYEVSAVMLAGVIEYLCAEVLELAGDCANDLRKKRINPRHLFLSIKNDTELDSLFAHATLSQGGAVPFIHPRYFLFSC